MTPLMLPRIAPPTMIWEGNLRIATFIRACTAAVAFAGLAITPAHAAAPPADDFARSYWYDSVDRRYEQNGSYPCTSYTQRWPSWPIDRFDNDCHTRRVWLYENIDKTGHPICISPGSIRLIAEAYSRPAILEVGAEALCP